MPLPPLTILYRDENYIAVDKPDGLQVHRSWISEESEQFLLQRLRDQIGQRVYTIHRLDRPTSGVILFGLSSEAARAMCGLFENHRVKKTYLAVARGYCDPQGHIDYPLREEPDKPLQQAITDYRTLATAELPIPVGRYSTARYSLVEIKPLTGRSRQIRKHFHHIFHPLIGDTSHGEGRHNRLYRERFAVHRLLLHAWKLAFPHPLSGEEMEIIAPLPEAFVRVMGEFGWEGV
ncbi:MAG: pseudouridine synthase [Gammaproteobacteria bacterium]|nr:pseudouridine synthase [Gammaproteobacteria bacterium]MCW8993621.1 pseudouridine synthase [Gammaproteobacteria bacterium]